MDLCCVPRPERVMVGDEGLMSDQWSVTWSLRVHLVVRVGQVCGVVTQCEGTTGSRDTQTDHLQVVLGPH